jgi:hypothetical protein
VDFNPVLSSDPVSYSERRFSTSGPGTKITQRPGMEIKVLKVSPKHLVLLDGQRRFIADGGKPYAVQINPTTPRNLIVMAINEWNIMSSIVGELPWTKTFKALYQIKKKFPHSNEDFYKSMISNPCTVELAKELGKPKKSGKKDFSGINKR